MIRNKRPRVVFVLMMTVALALAALPVTPASAAITPVTGNSWSNIFTNTNAFPGTIAYAVNAGSGATRMLVVAVASSLDAVGSQTISVTYGGQSLTQVTSDGGSTQSHTYLFYLQEAGLDLASNTNLVFTQSASGPSVNNVYAAVYDGVDQSGSPISVFRSGTGTTSVVITSMTVGTNEQAVEVVNMNRTGGTTYRTISTPATNWTSVVGPGSSNDGTVYNSSYILTDTTAAATTANHTLSSTTASIYAMSAMSIKAANSTMAGTATATAASTTSIAVSMPYTDDANGNNTYTVDYKLSTASTWTNWVTAAAHTASPYATTITGLTASTSYDVRVTYNDADSVTGTNPQTISGVRTAVRLYLQNVSYTAPTTRGTWSSSGSAVSRVMSTAKSGTITSIGVAETNTTNNYTVMLAKFVSEPLTAQTIAGTLNWVIGAQESSTSANDSYRVHAYYYNEK